jgi:hypothetical protein
LLSFVKIEKEDDKLNSPRLTLFTEKQYFRQVWIWIPVAFLAGLSWYSFVQQIVQGKPFGTHPAPDAVVWIIWVVFGLVFPVFFFRFGLTTEVSEEGLRIRFSPFYHRLVGLQDIRSFMVKEYRPIKDYGGRGVRWSPRHGMAYNVSGSRGVLLELRDGKHLLIGSRKPELLAGALESLLPRARRDR